MRAPWQWILQLHAIAARKSVNKYAERFLKICIKHKCDPQNKGDQQHNKYKENKNGCNPRNMRVRRNKTQDNEDQGVANCKFRSFTTIEPQTWIWHARNQWNALNLEATKQYSIWILSLSNDNHFYAKNQYRDFALRSWDSQKKVVEFKDKVTGHWLKLTGLD